MAEYVENDVPELDLDDLAPSAKIKRIGRYRKIIEDIFQRHFEIGMTEFQFNREEISETALRLKIKAPKNLGDVIYAYRYRQPLPKAILKTQPKNLYWLILGAGDAVYRFKLSKLITILPQRGKVVRKIPDATPEIIGRYTLGDEQALLAKVRYNRLIDVFLGVAAYSLQNHLRTKIPNYGQIEIDQLYTGIDSKGAQYVIPVQAKCKNDKLGVIQTIQDSAFCSWNEKYRDCISRTVSAQFMDDGVIAMFELVFDGDEVSIHREEHYKLVPSSEISAVDLMGYRQGN